MSAAPVSQDFQTFLAQYREAHPDDVLVVRDEVSAGKASFKANG